MTDNNGLTAIQMRHRIERAMILLDSARDLTRVEKSEISAESYYPKNYDAWLAIQRAENTIKHAIGDLIRHKNEIGE